MAEKIFYQEGDKVGSLIFIKDVPGKPSRRKALFVCHCNAQFEAVIGVVRQGNITECKDCATLSRRRLLLERNTKHGMAKSPEYSSWAEMKKRCNSTGRHARWYKNKGIVVCERWANSFENFFEDMDQKPSPDHSIERIDPNGNYEPSNCKWLLKRLQPLNLSTTNYITYQGITKAIHEWAAERGWRTKILYKRIFQLKWPIEKAMTQPLIDVTKKGQKKHYAVKRNRGSNGRFSINEIQFPEIRHAFGFIN